MRTGRTSENRAWRVGGAFFRASVIRAACIVGLALAFATRPADADTCDCRTDCADRAAPNAGMSYEDEEHRLWYEVRFWTGQCEGEIWLTCWSGPSWYDVMDKVIAQGSAADRPQICQRLFALGRRMGHEWARDNAIRSIHTSDLDQWKDQLLETDDPLRAIGELEALVDARLK